MSMLCLLCLLVSRKMLVSGSGFEMLSVIRFLVCLDFVVVVVICMRLCVCLDVVIVFFESFGCVFRVCLI